MIVKLTRFLLPTSILAGSLVLGACDGGSAPKIKSFQASQTALPEGGADVTFTWDVKGEKTLELLPYPGAVSGSSATVTITEAGTFTLVAKKGGRRDTKKIAFTVGAAFAVNGQAVDYDGQPVASAQLFVDEQVVVTDEDGFFTATGVVPPYDLGWIQSEPGQVSVVMYRGVTRPDPIMLVPEFDAVYNGYATISGTVSGGDGFPYPTPTPDPGYGTEFEITVPGGANGASFDFDSSADYAAEIYWEDPADDQPIVVGALQYRTMPTLSYTGFGRNALTVSDDLSFDADLALTTVGNGQLDLTVEAPFLVEDAQFDVSMNVGTLSAGGFPQAYLESYDLFGMSLTSAGTVAVPIPTGIADSTFSAYAYAYGADGYGASVRNDLAAGSSATLSVPRIPVLLTPVDDATVSPQTVFSLSAVEEAQPLYQFYFESSLSFGIPGPGGVQIDVTVITNDNQIGFPDQLAVFGIPLEGYFGWSGGAVVGYEGLNGFLQNGGIPASGNYALSYPYDSRFFYYGESGGIKTAAHGASR